MNFSYISYGSCSCFHFKEIIRFFCTLLFESNCITFDISRFNYSFACLGIESFSVEWFSISGNFNLLCLVDAYSFFLLFRGEA